TSLGENKSVKFTLDDCDYTLTYSVCETTLVVENDVNQLLNEFEKSSAPGVWPNIIKDELIKDIRAIGLCQVKVGNDLFILLFYWFTCFEGQCEILILLI